MWTQAVASLSACWLALFGFSFAAAAQSTPPTPPSDASRGTMRSRLAKKLQNPMGARRAQPAPSPRPVAQSVISTAFRFRRIRGSTPARTKGTQDILVQLVIPIHINEVWSIITRTTLPLVWQAVVPVGANRAVRRQPDLVLGVPVTKDTQQRLAVEYRPVVRSNGERQEPRIHHVGW